MAERPRGSGGAAGVGRTLGEEYYWEMRTVTLAIEDGILERSKDLAQRQGVTLDNLVGELLEQAVGEVPKGHIEAVFNAMDAAGGRSDGRRWRRDELYDVEDVR